MRQLVAALAAAAVTALGALFLGEYELVGTTPYVAGLLFGTVVGELVLSIARPRPAAPVALLAVVLPVVGMVWAAWISSGRDWDYVTEGAWAGAWLAPLAAALWLRQSRGKAQAAPAAGEQA